MRLLIAIIVGLDVFVFTMAFYLLKKDERQRRKEHLLKTLTPQPRPKVNGDVYQKQDASNGRLTVMLSRFIDLSGLEAMCAAAGVSVSLERFLCLALGLGLLFMIPAAVVLPHPLVLMVFMAGGIALPFVYLVHRRKKREEALVRQLPDALDMMVRSLRVGQSVDGALREVGRGFLPPIGAEIRTIYEEIAMGLPFEQALRNFERRFAHVPDVKILCTAFVVQRETGGNLTRILQGLSGTIRERFQVKRQIRTLTAEGRASAKILAILPLVFGGLVWLLNPDYIRVIFSHPMGRKMLLYAVFSVTIGFLIMRWMTRIEV
jgi:tight adherence protein B